MPKSGVTISYIAVFKCGSLIFVSAVIRYGGNYVRFAGDIRCVTAVEPIGTPLKETRLCSVLVLRFRRQNACRDVYENHFMYPPLIFPRRMRRPEEDGSAGGVPDSRLRRRQLF